MQSLHRPSNFEKDPVPGVDAPETATRKLESRIIKSTIVITSTRWLTREKFRNADT
ncbi:MAG: hypothetical protein LC753_16095 [Acidobacteria bacterium]|nr:hypothetical protein [Acidobacteriota bacterium]MCA1651718.1 hypothetical protein [Acidobacteriota bacterium]